MSAQIRELRSPGTVWTITARGEWIVLSTVPTSPKATTIDLNTLDPRVGMVVVWDTYELEDAHAIVRAVVRDAGRDVCLLLEDAWGYPWVYAPLDARVVSLDEGDYRC